MRSRFLGGMNLPENPFIDDRSRDEWFLQQAAKVSSAPYAEAFRRLLLRHDPIFAVANPASQQNEYDMEIPMVADALCRCDDYKSLREELRRIFARTVGTFEAGTVSRYTKLAQELLKITNATPTAP